MVKALSLDVGSVDEILVLVTTSCGLEQMPELLCASLVSSVTEGKYQDVRITNMSVCKVLERDGTGKSKAVTRESPGLRTGDSWLAGLPLRCPRCLGDAV